MSGKNKGIRKGASFSLIHKLCEYQAVRKLAETKGYPVRCVAALGSAVLPIIIG